MPRTPQPRALRNLVVIEAPGKLPALTRALERARLPDFHLLATGGYVYEMPEALEPLGIDAELNETLRAPRRPQTLSDILAWARGAARIVIATDSDQEGDVIAVDLARFLTEALPGCADRLVRVRLRALDFDSVVAAFAAPQPIRQRDAWPGETRRLVDRLLGAAFARRDEPRGESVDVPPGFAAGRVQSALLGSLAGAAANSLPRGEALLALNGCDQRMPFVARVTLTPENRRELEEAVAACNAWNEQGRCVGPGKTAPAPPYLPWNHGEAVLETAGATGTSLAEAAGALQRLYERGRLSYARSSEHALTGAGIARVASIADQHGVRFDGARVPGFVAHGRHAHESPRPLGGDVNVAAPLLLLAQDEATLSLVTRHLIACGQPHVLQRAAPEGLPEWTRQHPEWRFERRVCQWLTPWPRRPATAELRFYTHEQVAMRTLLERGLGRPSTQVEHAMKFAGRELLDPDFALSSRGAAWLAATPATLLDPATSAAIERMIEHSADLGEDAQPPANLARDILRRLDLWPQIERILRHEPAAHYGAAL